MTYDLLIVGGGINGCAIARDAALRGLSVLLVERDDIAGHTSSASSKLIHGGLRYLETREFRLVREALHERERMLAAAPHLIRPMAFVLPHAHAVRPWWVIRAGLLLYDLLAGTTALPRSRSLKSGDTAYTAPLKGEHRGFVYTDAVVDDARLTLANAQDAAVNGAKIVTRTALRSAHRDDELWRASLSDGHTVTARALVNAAGPWVRELLDRLGIASRAGVRLVKGSHIVVPALHTGDHAYLLQQPDGRVVFAVAWQGLTAIGTTDTPIDDPEDAGITDGERDYLLAAANRYFLRQLGRHDIVSTWSGIRALYDDGKAAAQKITRDYRLELDQDGPPLLSVFGGKITTARALAYEAMARLAPLLGVDRQDVTRTRVLPGGATGDFEIFLAETRRRWPFLGDARSARMAHAYGSLLPEMLADVRNEGDMGRELGAGLTEVELRWMREREWAVTAEDVLWRRSKLGLDPVADAAAITAALAQP